MLAKFECVQNTIMSKSLERDFLRCCLLPAVLSIVWLLVSEEISGKFMDAWIYLITHVVYYLIAILYLYFFDPGLLKERLKLAHKNQIPQDKKWMKYYNPVFITWYFVLPFDCNRFHWSESIIDSFNPDLHAFLYTDGSSGWNVYIKWIFLLISIISNLGMLQAGRDNTFLAPTIRIQKDRNHKLVDKGLFGIIRHPMYCSVIINLICVTIFLKSLIVSTLVLIVIPALVWRMDIEEDLLKKNLDGYSDYMKRVKYRLIPYCY